MIRTGSRIWFARITIALWLLLILLQFQARGGPASGVSFSRAVYDRNNSLLRLTLSKDEKYRKFTKLRDISPFIQEAILIREDRFFYFHPGINPVALFKAVISFPGEKRGASTITMQTARLLYRLETRSVHGKLFQILSAFYLEMRYSKSQILEAYLNLIPLGQNIEGVGAASLIYFGKPASKLNPMEAITLCVIPPRPTFRTRKSAESQVEMQRFREILFGAWLRRHPEHSDLTVATVPLLAGGPLPFRAPHFNNMVLQNSPLDQSEIHTTLHLPFQSALERSIRDYIKVKQSIGVHNASAILIRTADTRILAYAGSADFSDESIAGQVDGTNALRSPGSALKPLLYALAIDRGLVHQHTVLRDAPIQFSTYSPENFEGEFLGPLSAQSALVLSRNVPAIAISARLKRPDFSDFLKDNGVPMPKPREYYGLAPILGGIEITMQELAAFYASLGREGVLAPVGFLPETPKGKSIFTPEAAFMTLEMLRSQQGDERTDDWIKRSFTTYWKTGTSAGFRDAWTAGIVGPYTLVVWVGNFDGSSNPAFVGRDVAAPLFFQITSAIASEDTSMHDEIKQPAGIHRIEVCSVSGKMPRHFCPARVKTWFIPGKSPIDTCDVHREILVDASTGLRSCGKSANVRKEVYEVWPSDIEKVFKTNGIPGRAPPRFAPECEEKDNQAEAPSITLPVRGVTYNAKENEELPLNATADSSATQIFWFLDDAFLGVSKPGEPFFWKARPGNFKIRIVDSIGGSDQTELKVTNQ
ncbi:MAG: penicillin-binding protein 1C [Spirochaetia bacterium]|nr:penicillin-binding protein 1C [Spirochaetia bacterium]